MPGTQEEPVQSQRHVVSTPETQTLRLTEASGCCGNFMLASKCLAWALTHSFGFRMNTLQERHFRYSVYGFLDYSHVGAGWPPNFCVESLLLCHLNWGEGGCGSRGTPLQDPLLLCVSCPQPPSPLCPASTSAKSPSPKTERTRASLESAGSCDPWAISRPN